MSLLNLLGGTVAKTASSAEPATAQAPGKGAVAFAHAVDDARRAAALDAETDAAASEESAPPGEAQVDGTRAEAASAVPAPLLPAAEPVEATETPITGPTPVAEPVEASGTPLTGPARAAEQVDATETPLTLRQAQGPLADHGSQTGAAPAAELVEATGTPLALRQAQGPLAAQGAPTPTTTPAAEPAETSGNPLTLRQAQGPLAAQGSMTPATTPAAEPVEASGTPLALRQAQGPLSAQGALSAQGPLAAQGALTATTTSAAETAGASDIPAAAPAAPATPATAAAGPAQAAAPMARPALLPQVSGPVLALTQAPDGDHQLTLTISPENLGPVTVRAHISGGAIHIELHAPTDLGRDALRTILADLRRDLAGAAAHATLAISSQDGGSGQSASQSGAGQSGSAFTAAQGQNSQGQGSQNGGAQNGAQSDRGLAGDRTGARATPDGDAATTPAPFTTPHGGIDVYA
ncbi:flagellar hook-length control protein FliK [Microbacterium aerolatum]|uniref:flagellar hook-length control protein FliK n=1 Tax=Microbacterium aerolatum TaxID=153731 RepID=UPI0016695D87|nr:flagellar hook-length control protein FliK [Microbacterium aerolatum]GGB15932.1 hypothetical protein GCM10007198_03110 [Microbacterium aerolatum]